MRLAALEAVICKEDGERSSSSGKLLGMFHGPEDGFFAIFALADLVEGQRWELMGAEDVLLLTIQASTLCLRRMAGMFAILSSRQPS